LDISPATFSLFFLVLVCGSEMVNADRVRRKLPSLLCDGPTTDKRHWAKRRRIENGLSRLRKQNPAKYHSLELRLLRILKDVEKAIQNN
jgi:hypothetical protein